MDKKKHVALWLRMLAKQEIRLARSQYIILRRQATLAPKLYASDGQEVAEFEIEESASETYESLVKSYTSTARELVSYTFDALGKSKKATFQEIVQGFIATESLKKTTYITETTRNILRETILNGQKEGIGVIEIADNIRLRLIQFSEIRARTIARTETHNAATFGMQAAAEETGLDLTREWVSVEDDRVREDHEDADGQIRRMDEDFFVGGEYIDRPGEGSPANSINCRCTIVYNSRD